jgi:hypothetical protein
MVDVSAVTSAAQGATGASKFVPGLGTLGNMASMGWDSYSAYSEEGKRREQLAQSLGLASLEAEADNSPALREHLNNLKETRNHAIKEAGFNLLSSGIGALAGTAIVGAFTAATAPVSIPIIGGATIAALVGGTAGGIAGGMVGSKAYKSLFVTDNKDAFAIGEIIARQQENKQPVSEAQTFALLASSLPPEQMQAVNDAIAQMTGGKAKSVSDAIKQGRRAELEGLMNDAGFDMLLASSLGLHQVPGVTVTAQITQMLNSGASVDNLLSSELREKMIFKMNEGNLGYMQGMDVSAPGGSPFPGGLPEGMDRPSRRER